MNEAGPADAALAEGWHWLSTLPRAAVAHAARGDEPLAAVGGLLAALDDPQQRLRVIHIAGSKGKGSTALYLEALLREFGLHTFTYTSPHLQRWTERLRIDAVPAEPGRALAALQAVQRAQRETGITPGFFEALTVAALWLAADAGADWTIVEAGIGGRADATNVVSPALCIITGIELEHTDRLGDSIAAIAREKAGIVKPGAALLSPRLPFEADAALAAAAERAGVERLCLYPVPRPPRAAGRHDGIPWHFADGILSVAAGSGLVRTRLAAGGGPMTANAALAIAAVARLGLVSRETLQRGSRVLATLSLPGRMETVSALPWVIVDTAHTPASAAALAASVRELAPERVHLLLSLSSGKDFEAFLAELLPVADAVTLTRADPLYSLDPRGLATAIHALRPELPLAVDEDVEAALGQCSSDHAGHALVLATGSVYLAGRVRGLLKSDG